MEVYKSLAVGEIDDEDESADDDTKNDLLDDDSVWNDLADNDEQLVTQSMAKCCSSRLACFAHTLQLTVKDGLDKIPSTKGQNVKSVIGKCVKLASICHQRAKFRELFEGNSGSGQSIPAANATRWNSQFTQIEVISSFNSPR